MSFRKPSRKLLITGTAICVFAVLAGYLWRDLHLGDSSGKIRLPDIVVENIAIDRLVNGKQWKLKSPRVEHKDGVIYGDSLDISITENNGKVTRIKALKGTFTRDNNDITMSSADAVMQDRKKTYRLSAGDMKYDAAKEFWHFSDGVRLTDDKTEVEGLRGEYDSKNGDCSVTDGGKITWNE